MSEEKTSSMRERIASVVGGLGVLVPGMIVSGFMPELDVLPFFGWVAVSTFAGGAAGALFDEDHPSIGAVAGLLFGVLAIPAVVYYVDWRVAMSSTFISWEFVVPLGLCFVPAYGLRWAGLRAVGRPSPG